MLQILEYSNILISSRRKTVIKIKSGTGSSMQTKYDLALYMHPDDYECMQYVTMDCILRASRGMTSHGRLFSFLFLPCTPDCLFCVIAFSRTVFILLHKVC